jgi:hypothetical protein
MKTLPVERRESDLEPTRDDLNRLLGQACRVPG